MDIAHAEKSFVGFQKSLSVGRNRLHSSFHKLFHLIQFTTIFESKIQARQSIINITLLYSLSVLLARST